MKTTMKEVSRRRPDSMLNFSPFQLLSFALFALAVVACVASPGAHAQRKRPSPRARKTTATAATAAVSTKAKTISNAAASKSITLQTEPKAVVWLDEVRRGVTDDSGRFEITKVSPGRHSLRVRAAGFGERTLSLLPAQRGALPLKLTRTTDEAELAFQQAEEARERAATDDARQATAELYRRAIRLRPRYAAAHVGLARVLLDLNDYEGALDEVEEARKDRPGFAEASVVEGRILRASSQNAEAVEAYGRAIREARGFQPEAHTGLGIIYEEEGKYEQAAAVYLKAVAQLADTEPVLYELLGRVYERLEKYKEAVAAYEKYLALAPTGKLAPAIESVIEQLRKQAAEQD
ncbi:MAG TPA: tetratricopeptide repeat protein [Pyrinomonadaceae bacterium]|jgi:Tfp pilus assembly protein PilF|nr:tetratricopeptide repeat protein [Pyrinomonadaceae bacterium]